MLDILITDHGAVADGSTNCTPFIQAAIDACHAGGGGRVMIPPGRWISATLLLRSHVHIELQTNARLVGHPNPELYHHGLVPNDGISVSKNQNWNRALILAIDCTDVSICGNGTIDGNKVFDPNGEENMRGPHTVMFRRCVRSTIRDVTVLDSANYAIFFQGGSDGAVRNVVIEGGWDGVHWRASRGVSGNGLVISDCRIHTGDDAIAGAYCNDVHVSNCVLNSSCNAVRLIGPAEGVFIHDCLMYGPGRHPHRTTNNTTSLAALCIQPGGWGPMPGLFTNVVITRCTMRDISTPIIAMLKHPQDNGSLTITDIEASGVHRAPISIESWGGTPWTSVTLRRITMRCATDMTPCAVDADINPPHVDARPLPTWGLFARAVTELTLDHVHLDRQGDDPRPALRMEQVGTLRSHDVYTSPTAVAPRLNVALHLPLWQQVPGLSPR